MLTVSYVLRSFRSEKKPTLLLFVASSACPHPSFPSTLANFQILPSKPRTYHSESSIHPTLTSIARLLIAFDAPTHVQRKPPYTTDETRHATASLPHSHDLSSIIATVSFCDHDEWLRVPPACHVTYGLMPAAACGPQIETADVSSSFESRSA